MDPAHAVQYFGQGAVAELSDLVCRDHRHSRWRIGDLAHEARRPSNIGFNQFFKRQQHQTV